MAGFNQWEPLVWQEIQNEGLDTVCQVQSGCQRDTFTEAAKKSNHSPAVSSMAADSDRVVVNLPSAAGDAGSGCFPRTATADANVSDQAADEGPFASVEHQQLAAAPSARLFLPHASSLKPNRSLVTYKTKALAAAAGSVRTGAVGSGLRLAAIINRSSSGGLADTLLAEHQRAESGLLTAGLGRSDSLPEFNLVPQTAELSELVSLRDLDFLAGVPTRPSGLPSLSFLFAEPSTDILHQPPTGLQGKVPMPAHSGGYAADEGPLCSEAVEAGMDYGGDTLPLHLTSSRALGRPPSFTTNTAAALFGSSAPLVAHPHSLLEAHMAGSAAGQHPTDLRPPAWVDFSAHLMQLPCAAAPAPQAVAAAAAPGSLTAVREYTSLAVPADASRGAAGGLLDSISFPSFSRLPLLMDRQDTFDVLLRQVDQELTAEAEIRQYAALEFDTMDVPPAAVTAELQAQTAAAAAAEAAAAAAAAAAAQSPFMCEAAAAAAAAAAAVAATVPAVLQAAAEAPIKRRSVFQVQPLKRRSVFEGPAALMPADLSSASGLTTAALDATGPSFAAWMGASKPSASNPSTSNQTAVMVPPTSPFSVAEVPGLSSAGVSTSGASAGAGVEAGGVAMEDVSAEAVAAATAKQEVARYSRVITCKTYLKRLNITQPMAEHLLPTHELNPTTPTKGAAAGSCNGDESPKRPGSTYEQLFKEMITVVDDQGATFRVQYEGVSCNAQKHLRLTSGWRDFIRTHNVQVGDSIVFERRGNERRVLYVTVVKAGEASAVDLGPEPKKRRVRKDAVQRLS